MGQLVSGPGEGGAGRRPGRLSPSGRALRERPGRRPARRLLGTWAALLAMALSAPPGALAQETALPAREDDRLVVQNFSGRLLVVAEETSDVRIERGSRARMDLRLVRRGDRISVEPLERREGEREMDGELRVPSWMDVAIRGLDLDVRIRGVGGSVEVRNVEGDIELTDLAGSVWASTVDGSVTARRTRGDLALRAQGDDIVVEDAMARVVEVESGDGDLTLLGVDADEVRAETLDGDLTFEGRIRAGGRYRLSTHDGDAEILIPRTAGARVSVSTFDGEFISDFPVTVDGFHGGRTFAFTLGDGDASLEIEVFDGEIRLVEAR